MRKNERRQDLLRAAREVFATRGYHDAKVDDIVAAARVAKGTFYLYFPDKRSVFVELVDHLFTQINAAIVRVETEGDVAAQVRRNIRAIVGVLLDEPQTTQILMTHAAGLDPAFAAKLASFYDGVRTLLCETLAEGQRLGLVAEGDPDLFAAFTIGAIKEVLLEMSSGRGRAPAREAVADGLYALLERGYMRFGAPASAAPAAAPAPKPRARARAR